MVVLSSSSSQPGSPVAGPAAAVTAADATARAAGEGAGTEARGATAEGPEVAQESSPRPPPSDFAPASDGPPSADISTAPAGVTSFRSASFRRRTGLAAALGLDGGGSEGGTAERRGRCDGGGGGTLRVAGLLPGTGGSGGAALSAAARLPATRGTGAPASPTRPTPGA